jgi:hypothetical protein
VEPGDVIFTPLSAAEESSIARKLLASPMRVFARWAELSLDVAIERSQHSDMSMH